LLADTSRLAESSDRVSQVSQQLPDRISSEREHLVATLKSERQGLTALASESRAALTAGKQMADSANATLQSFKAVLAQLAARAPAANSEPFRIADYTAAAAQIAQTSERLAELLSMANQTLGAGNLDGLSSRLDVVTARAEARGRDLVDYAYRKILIAAALVGSMALAFALAYQFLCAAIRRVGERRLPPNSH
jgi:hypothetical protein